MISPTTSWICAASAILNSKAFASFFSSVSTCRIIPLGPYLIYVSNPSSEQVAVVLHVLGTFIVEIIQDPIHQIVVESKTVKALEVFVTQIISSVTSIDSHLEIDKVVDSKVVFERKNTFIVFSSQRHLCASQEQTNLIKSGWASFWLWTAG